MTKLFTPELFNKYMSYLDKNVSLNMHAQRRLMDEVAMEWAVTINLNSALTDYEDFLEEKGLTEEYDNWLEGKWLDGGDS